MDEVYDMYFQNQLSTEIVDLLAESEFMSEEVFNKKVTRLMSLETLSRRFPEAVNPAHAFPPGVREELPEGSRFQDN